MALAVKCCDSIMSVINNNTITIVLYYFNPNMLR